MLILTYANGLGIDFDQLRQRVLQPARDGNRAAQGNVKLREFFCGELGGGIDGRTRFADDHIGDLAVNGFEQFCRENFRLLGGGSIADGDDLHTVLFNQAAESNLRLLLLRFAVRDIDDPRIQHATRCIHNGDFAARPVAGVQSQSHLAFHGRLEQQLAKVGGKNLDCSRCRTLRERRADFTLNGGLDEAVICVFACLLHGRCAGRTCIFQSNTGDYLHSARAIKGNVYLQEILPLAPVDCQHLIARDFLHRHAEIIIRRIDAVLLFCCLRMHHAAHGEEIAEPAPDIGVI